MEKDTNDMNSNEEYEPQIIDLDGEPFEVIDGICYEGTNYVALVPYTESDEMETEAEFVILKEIEENGEFLLSTIDDEALYKELGDVFLERFESDFEECGDEGCDCGCH